MPEDRAPRHDTETMDDLDAALAEVQRAIEEGFLLLGVPRRQEPPHDR